MSATAPRRLEVGGKIVGIVDGLLPEDELVAIHDGLLIRPYRRTEFARPDTKDVRHWATEFDNKAVQTQPLYRRTLDALVDLTGRSDWNLDRAYCNVAAHGDMLYAHRDCTPEDGAFTAMWFICREWKVDYGGETLFFDDGEAKAVASPKPGRLVLFDGSLVHVGRPPNRICFEPRFTLVLKLSPSASRDA